MSATKLYTPEVLGLAVSLVQFPLTDAQPLQSEARSKSCGSSLSLGLALNEDGAVEAIGLRCQACAVGQAAAAIFASAAVGLTQCEVQSAHDAISAWLVSGGELPQWAGLQTIAPARDYPARHGAVLLPWDAALKAFSQI